MSAGAFVISKYEDSEGEIYPCRVQPETLALTVDTTANAAPTGANTQRLFARMRGSKRAYGLVARQIRISWSGAPPTGYKAGETLTIPIMQAVTFAGINIGDTGSYLETAFTVQSKISEGGAGIAV